MKVPAVSIVTAAFNAAATIGETIRSVQAQTIVDWEMIIVDDGSTDQTLEIASSFKDPRIRCIAIEHTGTAAAPRNRGILEAQAALIAFLDSDDMWLPSFLEAELHVLQKSNATLVHCEWFNLIDGQITPERSHCPPGVMGPPELLRMLVRQHLMSLCAVIVKKSALLEIGMFDPDPRLRGPEDFDLWLRLAPQSTFIHITDRLLVVRIRKESISRNAPISISGAIWALQKLQRQRPLLVSSMEDEFRTRLADLSFELGVHRLLHGLPGYGRQELKESLKQKNRNLRAWFWLALALSGPAAARTWTKVRHTVAF